MGTGVNDRVLGEAPGPLEKMRSEAKLLCSARRSRLAISVRRTLLVLDQVSYRPFQGLMMVNPQSSKSSVFRVASIAFRDWHTEAISASN